MHGEEKAGENLNNVSLLQSRPWNLQLQQSRLHEEKGVVLVEKASSTWYNEVTKEIELLKRQDIAVLGGIVVE